MPDTDTKSAIMEKEAIENSDFEKSICISPDIFIGYTVHSMLHSATVDMDPTKLHMLDRFEKTSSGGHQYSPEDTNVKIVISGRDWSNKNINIYGSNSTQEAIRYMEKISEIVEEIGHRFEIKQEPQISNLAINGDFGYDLHLENLYLSLSQEEYDTVYEPEQFPGLKVTLTEPSCTFLLFGTGTFVIQGLNKKSNIEPSIEQIVDLISDEKYFS